MEQLSVGIGKQVAQDWDFWEKSKDQDKEEKYWISAWKNLLYGGEGELKQGNWYSRVKSIVIRILGFG